MYMPVRTVCKRQYDTNNGLSSTFSPKTQPIYYVACVARAECFNTVSCDETISYSEYQAVDEGIHGFSEHLEYCIFFSFLSIENDYSLKHFSRLWSLTFNWQKNIFTIDRVAKDSVWWRRGRSSQTKTKMQLADACCFRFVFVHPFIRIECNIPQNANVLVSESYVWAGKQEPDFDVSALAQRNRKVSVSYINCDNCYICDLRQ